MFLPHLVKGAPFRSPFTVHPSESPVTPAVHRVHLLRPKALVLGFLEQRNPQVRQRPPRTRKGRKGGGPTGEGEGICSESYIGLGFDVFLIKHPIPSLNCAGMKDSWMPRPFFCPEASPNGSRSQHLLKQRAEARGWGAPCSTFTACSIGRERIPSTPWLPSEHQLVKAKSTGHLHPSYPIRGFPIDRFFPRTILQLKQYSPPQQKRTQPKTHTHRNW